MARVTVAIPTFNRARWLPRAIESVLSQTFEDLTLLVSDNASTDETPDVVAGYDDARIEYRRQPANVGILENHNTVFRSIETEYFLILPDDDRLAPEHLARTVPVLDAHPRAGIVHTGFDVLAPSGATVAAAENWTDGLEADAVESGARFIRESMLYSCRVCASTALTRTAALPPDLFRPDEFPAIDFGMWLRIALDWDMAFVADSLGAYSIHDASHSAAPGVGTPMHAGYIQDFAHIDKLLQLKLRFLDRFPDRLQEEPGELAALARRGYHRELLQAARNLTLPERRLRPTARAFAATVRHEPAMAGDRGLWRLLAASVLGGRVVERIKARTARREAAGEVT